VARRASFLELLDLPVGAHDGCHGGSAHEALADRHRRIAGPFYNPLRLAEEVALLDVLSGGRVNWGAGRGFERSEFKAFGIPGEESTSRFHEAVDIVLKAWTNDKLCYQGKYFSYEGVEVLPKPLQAPHPPIAVSGSCQLLAGVDGGNISARDRLGGVPRFFDPDGPPFLSCGSHRQAP
jgi:hypothetical protein